MPVPITLVNGWNFIGWPVNAPEWTNEQLLDDLANKGLEPVTIVRWDTLRARTEVHDWKSTANIWMLQAGLGYQVRVNKGGPYDLPGGSIEVTKEVEKLVEIPTFDTGVIVDWVKNNRLLSVIAVIGGLWILGDLSRGVRRML